jgi:hypothetical protein
MKWFVKYILAVLPPVLFYGIWQLADWAYIHYECQGNLKSLESCYAGSHNIIGFLGIGLFWCQILFYPAIVFSGLLLIVVYLEHLASKEK